MIKIVCDRCGKEISEEIGENELMFTGKRRTAFGIDERMNLCDDCLKEFREFMKGK